MRKGIIDRFEGDFAVIEFNSTTEDIAKSEIPSEAKPGDALIFDDDGIKIDEKHTASQKKEIDGLINDLFK